MTDIPVRLLIGASLFPIILASLYIRQFLAMSPGIKRSLSQPLLLFGLALAAYAIQGVLLPGAPLAAGSLGPGEHLSLTLPAKPVAVLVDGELPATTVGRTTKGDFELSVSPETGEPLTLGGTLSKHFEEGGVRVRAAKTLVDETERRLDLPEGLEGETVTIALVEITGDLKPPLSLSVIPGPPPGKPLWVAMGVLTLLAAALDQWTQRKTYFAPALACMTAFAALIGPNVVPHAHIRFLFGVVVVATAAGLGSSGLLRILFSLVFGGGEKAPPRPKPPKPILDVEG